MGGGAPVVVQSMTNTDTADVVATAVRSWSSRGRAPRSCASRSTRRGRAARCPSIRERLDRMGVDVPLVGDFHYNGHRLLAEYPACAEALAKYRINPGNVGYGDKRDRQFAQMVEAALATTGRCASASTGAASTRNCWRALMDENARPRRAVGRADTCCARRWCAPRSTAPPRRASSACGRPDRALVQGQRRAGPGRGLPRARRAAATTRCTSA